MLMEFRHLKKSATGAFFVALVFAGMPVSAEDTSPSHPSFRIQKASDLIGKPVHDRRGELLGEVKDLVIDTQRGRVAYVVVIMSEMLGSGGNWFAVPTPAMTLKEDGSQFVLAATMDRLKNAPGFDHAQWPRMSDSNWGVRIHEFYRIRPYWIIEGERQGSTSTSLRLQKASELIGCPVQSDRYEWLGEIEELVIDPDRYRIAYVVLAFAGLEGECRKLFAIPGGVIRLPTDGGPGLLSIDKKPLKQSTGFDKSKWPNLADPTLASGIYEFYGKQPYWTQDPAVGNYYVSALGVRCHRCDRPIPGGGFVSDAQNDSCSRCAYLTGYTYALKADKLHP